MAKILKMVSFVRAALRLLPQAAKDFATFATVCRSLATVCRSLAVCRTYFYKKNCDVNSKIIFAGEKDASDRFKRIDSKN